MNSPTTTRTRMFACAVGAGLFSLAQIRGADLDFYRDVYPVLKANCISCHNKTTTKGGLNMESPEMMRKGGENGPGAVPGKGAESMVVQASVHTEDLVMPPKNNKTGAVNLTTQEIGLLRTWIDQGAKNSVKQARQVVWQPLPPGIQPIYTVSMTQDGRYAACGRANQIFLYDLATRQFTTRLTDDALKQQNGSVAHRALVQGLAFSPDGKRLASGSFREVKVWRREDAPAATSSDKATAPLDKKVSIDGGKVRLLNAADGKVIRELTIPGAAAASLSPDGKQVVAACADGAVRLWDAVAGKQVAEMRGDLDSVKRIAELDWTFAAQGLDLAFQTKEATRIEAENKALEELLKKANETIPAVKKTLPDKQAAAAKALEAKAEAQKAADAVAEPAQAPEGKADAALQKQHTEAQAKLASASMAAASAVAAANAAQNQITDAEADIKNITAAKAKNSAAITTANAAAAAAKAAQAKATAELATAKQQQTAKGGIRPLAVAFSTDAQIIAAIFADGGLRAWAAASGMPIEKVPGTAATQSATLTCGGDGTFTATTAQGVKCSLATGSHWVLERVLGGDNADSPLIDRVNAVCFSPDGKTLAVGGGEPSRSGDISLWDTASGKLLKNWLGRHNDAVLSLDFSPDGKLIASGGADKLALVTDIGSGKQVRLFEGHTHHVMGVAFRADGRTLATSGGDNVVLVWDMLLGERKKKIEGWTKEVTSIQYIGATNQLLTSAGDNLIRIVQDEGPEVRAIAKLPDFMQSAASATTASVIVGGGEDSLLRVWDGTNGKELAAFGAK